MKVTNATKAVINYRGKVFGPGAAIDLRDGDEKRGDISRMLGDGRLSVSLKAEAPASKPSDGLKVDDIKAALTAKGIGFEGVTKRDELAALLDA